MFKPEDYKKLPTEFDEDEEFGYFIRVVECFKDFDANDESTYADWGVQFRVDYVDGTDGDYFFIRVRRRDFEEWFDEGLGAEDNSVIFMLDCNEHGDKLCYEIAPVAVTEEYVYFKRTDCEE